MGLRLLLGRATVVARTRGVPGGAVRPFTLERKRSARRELVRARSLRVIAVVAVRTSAGHRGTTRTSVLLLAREHAARR